MCFRCEGSFFKNRVLKCRAIKGIVKGLLVTCALMWGVGCQAPTISCQNQLPEDAHHANAGCLIAAHNKVIVVKHRITGKSGLPAGTANAGSGHPVRRVVRPGKRWGSASQSRNTWLPLIIIFDYIIAARPIPR